MLSDEYDSDYEAEFDEEIVNELEENRKLSIINKFRNCIIAEPEFCGISNVSDFFIMENLCNTRSDKKPKVKLTLQQLKLFDDLYMEIYGYVPHEKQCENLANVIYKKMYV
tara:strand:+ start:11853 stop:12185 length:333 start_codon:yes stop_codon:yes gene_type:complete